MESVFVTRREGIISNIFWETMLDEIKKIVFKNLATFTYSTNVIVRSGRSTCFEILVYNHCDS